MTKDVDPLYLSAALERLTARPERHDTRLFMVAKKKRRRRKVDDTPQDNAGLPADEAESPGKQDEREGAGVGGAILPPLPSELGSDAVQSAQDGAGQDVLSAASFQPTPEVMDTEMADGGNEGVQVDLLDTPTRKKGKYKFDLDIELPLESESKEAGKTAKLSVAPQRPDGVMPLPDFKDMARRPRRKDVERQAENVKDGRRVERGDVRAFTSLLELDPEADSEEALFTRESYDAFSGILGEGKPFVGIANSYLQTGHTVLLGLTLLCGFVDLPGFPLTQLPYDIREFLKTGLLVTYVINTAIAYLSYLEAKRVGQPAGFWAIKGFVLGGLAFNELSQVESTARAQQSQDSRNRR